MIQFRCESFIGHHLWSRLSGLSFSAGPREGECLNDEAYGMVVLPCATQQTGVAECCHNIIHDNALAILYQTGANQKPFLCHVLLTAFYCWMMKPDQSRPRAEAS